MTDDTIDTSNISPIKTDNVVIHDILPADPAPVADPVSAAAPDRLRAYEDHLFGPDCVRIRGQIERGYGSKFKDMTATQVRHYEALEKLGVTEQALADAHAALIGAEATHLAALAEVEATEAEAHAAASE